MKRLEVVEFPIAQAPWEEEECLAADALPSWVVEAAQYLREQLDNIGEDDSDRQVQASAVQENMPLQVERRKARVP